MSKIEVKSKEDSYMCLEIQSRVTLSYHEAESTECLACAFASVLLPEQDGKQY
jgi:hypothetical protein